MSRKSWSEFQMDNHQRGERLMHACKLNVATWNLHHLNSKEELPCHVIKDDLPWHVLTWSFLLADFF